MKTKQIELNVDFIGGQTALTVAEEKALSDFFRQKKEDDLKPKIKKTNNTAKREKFLA